MADEDVKQEQASEGDGKEKTKGKGKKERKGSGKFSFLLIGLVTVLVSGGAGVAAAMLFDPATTELPPTTEPEGAIVPDAADKTSSEYEYYEFEDLTVNLNVQRQDRYIKVGVMLAVPKAHKEEVFSLVDKNKIFLKNWLMTFLAGHTLDQVQGKRNIVRMQREICNGFNNQLWPEAKPRIDHVLFKDFAIQ